MTTAEAYKEVFKRIPATIAADPYLDLSPEESVAIRTANHYYNQLCGNEDVGTKPGQETLQELCEQIQKLVPVIKPKFMTKEFETMFSSDPSMCRVYNYFNDTMEIVLSKPLTPSKHEKAPAPAKAPASAKAKADISEDAELVARLLPSMANALD
jgi:hypothetical protein